MKENSVEMHSFKIHIQNLDQLYCRKKDLIWCQNISPCSLTLHFWVEDLQHLIQKPFCFLLLLKMLMDIKEKIYIQYIYGQYCRKSISKFKAQDIILTRRSSFQIMGSKAPLYFALVIHHPKHCALFWIPLFKRERALRNIWIPALDKGFNLMA